MKVCNNCGNAVNENDSFCSKCGAGVSSGYPVYRQNDIQEPISVGGWIGRSLLPLIPLVGGIVYLILLFVWSGDTKKEETFRNWAKAQLIVMLVAVVLIVLFVAVALGIAAAS